MKSVSFLLKSGARVRISRNRREIRFDVEKQRDDSGYSVFGKGLSLDDFETLAAIAALIDRGWEMGYNAARRESALEKMQKTAYAGYDEEAIL